MTYEESIKWILEEVDKGEWDGNRDVNLSRQESGLVEQVIKDGYTKYTGDKLIKTKDGDIYTGKFVLTIRGKALLKQLRD